MISTSQADSEMWLIEDTGNREQIIIKLNVPQWMANTKYEFGSVELREEQGGQDAQECEANILIEGNSIGVCHAPSPGGDRAETAAVYTTSSNEVDINARKGHMTSIPESTSGNAGQTPDTLINSNTPSSSDKLDTSNTSLNMNIRKHILIPTKKLCSIAGVLKKNNFQQIKKKCQFLVAYGVIMILLFESSAASALPSGTYQQQATACIPIISDSSPERYGFRQIECEISTCVNWERIIYERTDANETEQWTRVLEVFNSTYYNAFDTESYALGKRIHYAQFPTKHILYICNVKLEDNGKWRCVVMDTDLVDYQSQAKKIVIYVTPTDDNVSIEPGTPALVEGASQPFTCTGNGIHPVPDVVWTVNGEEQRGGTLTTTRQDDGLWNVKHSKTLHFATIGLNHLSCQLSSKDCNPLLVTNITFDVKAHATLSNPKDTIFIFEYKNSPVTLNCRGLGYKPVITWVHNGNVIVQNDGRYNINQTCNESACVSSLTFTSSTQDLPCRHRADAEGDYKCVISLGTPYQSNQISPVMHVNPPLTPQDDTISIEHGTPAVMVDGQQAFTCTANGIHPVPDVVWTVNGVEQRGEILTTTRQDDGLRNIKHSKTLQFANIGLNEMSCLLYTKSRNPWLVKSVTIDVKEHGTADGMFPTLCSIVFGFILSALHTTKKQCSMVKEKKKRRFKPIKKEFAMDGCLSLIFDIFQSGKFLVPYAITMILLFEPMAATSLPSRNYHQRVCNPHISANILDEVEFKQIECEISSCNKVSKITYEKKGVTNNTQWTPVFEGYNKTVFQTVDMEESNYTLTNRNDYMAFHTKHLLYIKPVILKDQGEWRCVVHDEISGDCFSNSLEVNIYVTPKEDNLNIAPSNVILLSGQSEKFDCIIDGIHPEPDVWWTINNKEIIQGTPFNKKRMDGLWFVMNRVQVGFHETGKHALFCVVKTKTGDPWLQNSIHVDVKEDAYVSDPTDARTVSVTRNSSFTIDCHGSGYKPSITWQRDGTTILDTDYRYSMAHLCNDTFCRSSLTLKPMANLLTCASEDYIEVYTCTVALEKTFSSNHTSANINVHILNPPQINGTQMNIIAGQSCNTTLTCDVCRATSSVWKYNGTILMGEEVTHLSDGSLLLHSNMRFGQYTRTVRNAAGEVNCNVYLHDSGTTCNIQNYSTVIGVVSSLTLVALVLVAAIIVWKKRGTRYDPQNHKERQHGQSNILLIEKPEQ